MTQPPRGAAATLLLCCCCCFPSKREKRGSQACFSLLAGWADATLFLSRIMSFFWGGKVPCRSGSNGWISLVDFQGTDQLC
ncbi:hypothetical protein BDQ94DRAFT_90743 [Aspergillus welwitschiae]|uniref:Uncharacterized protein n=1 Tax=Aspergillus welwitschiae TaxID=1341132 RepID=A0A3F3QEH8_9EURO|nr:hypothetical protein BDQ94DRAFT_90743 [Aspergillus welwitschiae]RDH37537.1 hypothetical protein BDQ94DRAFT_90743 [Aspergillus welwitschiae]